MCNITALLQRLWDMNVCLCPSRYDRRSTGSQQGSQVRLHRSHVPDVILVDSKTLGFAQQLIRRARSRGAMDNMSASLIRDPNTEPLTNSGWIEACPPKNRRLRRVIAADRTRGCLARHQ